jgi:hypothetical protein
MQTFIDTLPVAKEKPMQLSDADSSFNRTARPR